MKKSRGYLFATLFFLGTSSIAQEIIGKFDTVNAVSASGWACVAGTAKTVDVHFYADGTFIGGTTANRPKGAPWAWFCGGNQSMKFDITFPQSLKPTGSKLVTAYAIYTDNSANPPKSTVTTLSGSPKRVNFPLNGTNPNIIFDQKNQNIGLDIDSRAITQADGEICIGMCIQVNQLAGTNGDGDTAAVSYDASVHTGFQPLVNAASELSLYQRGPNNNTNATTIQGQGVDIGLYLNSASQTQILPNANMAITPTNTIASPWSAASYSSEVVVSFEAQIKEATYYLAAESVPFAYATLRFRKKTNPNVWFYNTVLFYDPRPASNIEDVRPDIYGNKEPIILTQFGNGKIYGHMGNGSSTFSTVTWPNEYRYFEWRIGKAEFQAMLNKIVGSNSSSLFNGTPENYELYYFDVGPEMHRTDVSASSPSPNVTLGMAVRNIQIRIEGN